MHWEGFFYSSIILFSSDALSQKLYKLKATAAVNSDREIMRLLSSGDKIDLIAGAYMAG
jgi:hypothetical protein